MAWGIKTYFESYSKQALLKIYKDIELEKVRLSTAIEKIRLADKRQLLKDMLIYS